jgi:hypothetical protein
MLRGDVARVSVLGRPTIDNMAPMGRPIRRAAVELLVYLALHPEGASASRLTQVSGAADTLRDLLARASGGEPDQYVVQRQRLFHLALGDAADVDLWRVHEHLFRAACAFDAPTKITELKAACAEYKGPLADGAQFAWIAPHRERVDHLITEARDELAALDQSG